ncbi:transposase [Alicyclobacillus suci]|uniref:transposase n=1 Tax=Alicyclobacillus suci TaxID=2816080 RepID=UPI001A908CB1
MKQSGGDRFGKDTVYRFLNSPRHNWRRFLLLLSATVVQRMSRLTSDDRADVLIVDDSLFRRSRSKKVELLARVYDHVSHKFVRGFRMLTLGWSDGNSFVLIAFSLLCSENERNRVVVLNIASTNEPAVTSVGKRACKRQRMLCSDC